MLFIRHFLNQVVITEGQLTTQDQLVALLLNANAAPLWQDVLNLVLKKENNQWVAQTLNLTFEVLSRPDELAVFIFTSLFRGVISPGALITDRDVKAMEASHEVMSKAS